jgi:adenosylcobinamide-GDP ribazoletransferase
VSSISINSFRQWLKQQINSLCSSVVFYTVIPVPSQWTGAWQRIARWSPIVGLAIGGLLGLINIIGQVSGIPTLTRSGILVALWVGITGGLHLDGAMDAADGLAVNDPERRLSVMRDSATGAFGAIAAIIILLLKICALYDLNSHLWFVLMLAAGWGRWGQVMAISLYPYLRETGKGALHKDLRSPQDILLGLIILLVFSSLSWTWMSWWQILLIIFGSSAIAMLTGYWFNKQLQGHTGDTYGAVVEWTEALILCYLTAFN